MSEKNEDREVINLEQLKIAANYIKNKIDEYVESAESDG